MRFWRQGGNDQRPRYLRVLAATSSCPLVVSWWNTSIAASAVRGLSPDEIQTVLNTHGRERVITHAAKEGQADQEDVRQDFVAILTSLIARLYGRRRASRKQTQVLAALEAP